MLYDEYDDIVATYALGRAFLSGPKISGGMTAAEMQAQLDRQDALFAEKIRLQDESIAKQEALRRQNDEMLAARETQRAAAEAAAVEEAQKMLKAETKNQPKDKDLQSEFDSLFQSFMSGIPAGTPTDTNGAT